jgi:arylsulfatase A-like enzyme
MDLLPTVLELAGLVPSQPCQGVSLCPLLWDADADFPDRDFLIEGHHREYRLEPSALVAQVDGRWWSLVAETDTTGCLGTFRPERVSKVSGLFDLGADPLERTNLVDQYPELVTELKQRLGTQLAANAALAAQLIPSAPADDLLSEEAKRQLRALGY